MLFNFICYWLKALSQGNSARTCQGSFMCYSALSDMNTAQVRSSPLVLVSYKIVNGNSYHPPSRCSMKEKVPVTRSSSGRCFRKMHLVPAGTPILNVAVEATLGLYGVVPFLSDRNTGIASHLRPFRIFATLYLYTCRRARQLM